MRLQRTIRREVVFQGIGLHTGRYATVRLKPAPRDTGIVFCRIDRGAIIRANITSVTDTAYATTIGFGGVKIRTVEHLLATVSGLGINNLFVEVQGPEIPILDGSSTNLVDMVLDAGISKQGKEMPIMRITQPVEYEDAHARIIGVPFEGRRITYYIHFNHHLLGEQELTIELDEKTFVKDIAPARTFGFLRDVETLRANGLARGGSLDNAVIIGDDGILNSSGLRYGDEFVRHKILDAVGDLALLGFPIEGHITLEKAGHTANIRFLRKLLASIDGYTLLSEVGHSHRQVLAYS